MLPHAAGPTPLAESGVNFLEKRNGSRPRNSNKDRCRRFNRTGNSKYSRKTIHQDYQLQHRWQWLHDRRKAFQFFAAWKLVQKMATQVGLVFEYFSTSHIVLLHDSTLVPKFQYFLEQCTVSRSKIFPTVLGWW